MRSNQNTKNLNVMYRDFKQFSHDKIRMVWEDCGRNPAKCRKELEKKISEDEKDEKKMDRLWFHDKNQSDEYNQTRRELWHTLQPIYEEKNRTEDKTRRFQLEKDINRMVIAWNSDHNHTDIYDLHWMVPKGAAIYATDLIRSYLEWNDECRQKGEKEQLEKELKIITGYGKHSTNHLPLIQNQLFNWVHRHERRNEFTATVCSKNPGLVVVTFH